MRKRKKQQRGENQRASVQKIWARPYRRPTNLMRKVNKTQRERERDTQHTRTISLSELSSMFYSPICYFCFCLFISFFFYYFPLRFFRCFREGDFFPFVSFFSFSSSYVCVSLGLSFWSMRAGASERTWGRAWENGWWEHGRRRVGTSVRTARASV